MIHVYRAIYNCPEHGDFDRPTTINAHAGDTITCPKCKKVIPLVRTTPFRENTFGDRLMTK